MIPHPRIRPDYRLPRVGGHVAVVRRPTHVLLRVSAGLLMSIIFLLDTFTTLEGAVAVLYVVPVLLVAGTYRRRDIIMVSAAGILLTIAAYVDTHGFSHVGSQTVRALVSLSAVGIATLLALKNQRAMRDLSAQATLLDLSHDMIFVRDNASTITFWNRAAETVYGWPPKDALGRHADELLATQYPDHRQTIEAELQQAGRWEGTLEQTVRDGRTLVLDSRWALQRDDRGRVTGVMETHTDITERQAAHAALVSSERRYRRMFDESRIGVLQQDWSEVRAELEARGLTDPGMLAVHLIDHPEFVGELRRLARVEDVNPAFAGMFSSAGTTQAPRCVDDVIDDRDRTFASALLAFARGDAWCEGETEIVRGDGRRVPVIFTITFPSTDDVDSSVLVFVVDTTERRRAQDALLLAQTELARASRVATLGELTASIAHEVNQPLMAVVTNGEAGMRWLKRETPDLAEIEKAFYRTIAEGRRAEAIVQRIRSFLDKAPPHREPLEIQSLIEGAVQLVQHELSRHRIDVRLEFEPRLPTVVGDRVQLQQVLVNLILNAHQAMGEQSTPRRLAIRASRDGERLLAITVSDTGPGIASDDLPRLFDAFFTTKLQGMGMGLAISRTIAEAHGGRLTVESERDRGATFTLTISIASPGTPP